MYLERSSNQAEAIKCFRRVLDFEPHNREAIEQLKDMYEKRRDWERLVEVMRTEARPARRAAAGRAAPRDWRGSRPSGCASRRSASSCGRTC